MTKYVNIHRHQSFSTLDLVVTFADRVPESVAVQPPGAISDHALVTCSLSVGADLPVPTERL